MLIQSLTTFFTGIIIGFVKGWKLTLVILAISPLLGISAGIISKVRHNAMQLNRQRDDHVLAQAILYLAQWGS